MLLGVGLIMGLVVPYLLREITIGAEVQVRFIWSKSPFGTFDISFPVLFGFLGAVFVALAILRFILAQKSK